MAEKSNSLNYDDYEVLVRRRGENEFASYCPQLNLMVVGAFQEEVEDKIFTQIANHIHSLRVAENQKNSMN